MKWGIYDTQDNCWMGDDAGPTSLESKDLAQAAAQILEARITGTDLGGRLKAMPLPAGINQKRDEITPRYQLDATLKRMGVD